MSTSDRNPESIRIIWDYAWLLPSALTIFLVAMLCFSYTQGTADLKWLAHLVESLQTYAFDRINVFTHEDYQQGVRIRGLFSYGLVAVCYLGAGLVALVIGLCTIRSISDRRSWKRRALGLLILPVATGIAFHFFQTFGGRCGENDIWSQLVCKTIGDNWIISIHLWLDAFGIAIATFFALITSMILRPEAEPKIDKQDLENRIRCFRMMLYVSSAVLIFATLRMSAILHWALAYLQSPSVEDKGASFLVNNLAGFVSNLVTIIGAFYSLLLAAIFVPAILILNKQARKYPEMVSPLSQQLLRLAAIIGPLLAGPIGELLSRLN